MIEMWSREPINCFANLKSLTIANSTLCGLSRDNTSKLDLLPNLEELRLLDVEDLCSISGLSDRLGLRLHKLRVVEVTECPQLRFLFRYGNRKLNTKKLDVIKVNLCNNLCELFQHTAEGKKARGSRVPNQRIIEVKNCNALRKLPLRDLNPNTIQEIRRDEVWWTKLEQGSEENTKEHLQHVFKPVKDARPQLERTLTGRYPPQGNIKRGWH